ncbi:hypothetical protein BT93_H2449 [Corymbia citriodora subsp. variegata]|nr:hypothetical protein BT93_H2449 [Corymbia citriodora subsp. variegata]
MAFYQSQISKIISYVDESLEKGPHRSPCCTHIIRRNDMVQDNCYSAECDL